jgi:D-3-phosphoglycerate dehydrogenase
MRVIAWNRSVREYPGVEFLSLDDVLAQSHVVSLHLLLNDETRCMISREKIDKMRDGVILVNTARGAVIDEAAMIEALKRGKIGHAALDVFEVEPLPAGHPLAGIENVTLSAHSAFRTPEASDNLIEAALNHGRRISGG